MLYSFIMSLPAITPTLAADDSFLVDHSSFVISTLGAIVMILLGLLIASKKQNDHTKNNNVKLLLAAMQSNLDEQHKINAMQHDSLLSSLSKLETTLLTLNAIVSDYKRDTRAALQSHNDRLIVLETDHHHNHNNR